MNNHKETIFEAYDDFTPNYERYGHAHVYFPAVCFPNVPTINLLVTMYDEDVEELRRTLESIGEIIQHTRCKVRVIIIQDGWCRAHSTTKDYFRNTLSPTSSQARDELEPATHIGLSKTYMVQPVDDFTGELDPTWVSQSVQLPLTLVIKSDNRMKHNSHSWFYKAFCKDYSSLYLFMTDVGSTFHPECLVRLEKFLDQNDGLVGCHGYPWIAELQPHANWIQWYIRAMQEYELGPLATDHDRGFQSMFGFQQTLSGPCTMLRTEDATYPSLLSFMTAVLERAPSELNLLSSNLIIVEDTATTLYLFASSGKMLALVPDAYYYYDVETKPSRFLAQRRRWMNGVGCSLILFWRSYHKILKKSVHTKTIQIFVRAIIIIGIGTQVLFPFIQPALFAYVVFQSFNPGFCAAYPHALRSFQEHMLRPLAPWLPFSMATAYTLWFLIWTVYFSRSKTAYHPKIFAVTFTLCHTVGLYSYYAVLIVTIQVAFQLLPVWQRPIVAALIGLHYVVPIATSAFKGDLRTLRVATLGLIPYMTFFPMWSFIYGYNIARLWDVTWGNRKGVLDGEGRENSYQSQVQKITYRYLLVMLLAIGGLSFSSLSYNASYLHALYVVPWYLISTTMGVIGLFWTVRYQMHARKIIQMEEASASSEASEPIRSGPSLFRNPTFKKYQRMQRKFTFGSDRPAYLA